MKKWRIGGLVLFLLGVWSVLSVPPHFVGVGLVVSLVGLILMIYPETLVSVRKGK